VRTGRSSRRARVRSRSKSVSSLLGSSARNGRATRARSTWSPSVSGPARTHLSRFNSP